MRIVVWDGGAAAGSAGEGEAFWTEQIDSADRMNLQNLRPREVVQFWQWPRKRPELTMNRH